MGEWFEEWFGEEYLLLYPHRNDAEADQLVGLITREIPLGPNARVLDLACGAGRHARAFASRGLAPIGLDLSWHLVVQVRRTAHIPVVRGDLRALPFRELSADLVVNLFTSFGYFEHDAEHAAVLAQMVGTVRPGGWFVIDFLNARSVVRQPRVEEQRPLGGTTVRIERWVSDDRRFVFKTVTIQNGRRFMERVRLLDPDDLAAMLRQAGLTISASFGGYQGQPYQDDSPRVIIMGRRS